jgi:hypothetical protein
VEQLRARLAALQADNLRLRFGETTLAGLVACCSAQLDELSSIRGSSAAAAAAPRALLPPECAACACGAAAAAPAPPAWGAPPARTGSWGSGCGGGDASGGHCGGGSTPSCYADSPASAVSTSSLASCLTGAGGAAAPLARGAWSAPPPPPPPPAACACRAPGAAGAGAPRGGSPGAEPLLEVLESDMASLPATAPMPRHVLAGWRHVFEENVELAQQVGGGGAWGLRQVWGARAALLAPAGRARAFGPARPKLARRPPPDTAPPLPPSPQLRTLPERDARRAALLARFASRHAALRRMALARPLLRAELAATNFNTLTREAPPAGHAERAWAAVFAARPPGTAGLAKFTAVLDVYASAMVRPAAPCCRGFPRTLGALFAASPPPPPDPCRPSLTHPPPSPPPPHPPKPTPQATLREKQGAIQRDIAALVAARPGDPAAPLRLGASAPPPPPASSAAAAGAPEAAPEARLADALTALDSNLARQLNASAAFDWDPLVEPAAAAEAFAQSWPFWPDFAEGARAAVRAEWQRRRARGAQRQQRQQQQQQQQQQHGQPRPPLDF